MQDVLNKPQDLYLTLNLLKDRAKQGDGNAVMQIAELFAYNLKEIDKTQIDVDFCIKCLEETAKQDKCFFTFWVTCLLMANL